MPAIYLFERRTFLGGDDLQPAVFLAHFLRFVQLIGFLGPVFAHLAHESRKSGGIFALVLYDTNQLDDSCRHSHYFGLLLLTYATASACYSVGSGLLEWRISHWSGVGSPTQPEQRSRKVSYLLELKLVPFTIVLFLVFCTGLTMISFAPHYYRCKTDAEGQEEVVYGFFWRRNFFDEAENVTRKRFIEYLSLWWITTTLLLLTQLSEVAVSVIYLIHLCAQPRETNRFDSRAEGGLFMEEDYGIARHELMEEMWAKRCASFCQCLGVASCFMFGGREVVGQGDFGDIARALTDYLETRGVLDLVPSDIAAGFLVLRSLQKSRVHQSRRQIAQGRAQSIIIRAEEGLQQHETHTELTPPPSSDNRDCYPDPWEQIDEPPNVQNHLMRSVFRFSHNGVYESSSRNILSFTSNVDMMAFEEGARYAKYALAIYTWVLYLYVHPVSGIPRLAANGGLACWRRSRKRLFRSCEDGEDTRPLAPDILAGILHEHGCIEGDNMCETHKTALLLTAGVKEADLVYLQLKSGFRDTPYCILLDHERKSLVVAIRGTFSLEDCVTDVLIEPEPLDQLGREFGFNAENQFCHGGVLLWIRNIYGDLQRHQILQRLLLGDNAQYPDYTLRLVGHSLGAAACTILSYMLRPHFPTLRCLNYSPPGCSLTWDLAVGCKGWCTSFVLDSDIVPRLSFETMERWRDEILELIGRIKVPKAEVVRRFMETPNSRHCDACFDPPLDDPDASIGGIEDILYEPNEVPETEYKRQLERFKLIQEERKRSRGERRTIKLFPPGRILHFVKTGEKRACVHGIVKCLTCFTTNYGFQYTPVWIDNDDLNEIVISPQMGTDHFPNRMLNVVRTVAKEYGLKP